MISDKPTTLISLLGTEPVFRKSNDTEIKPSQTFINDLSKSFTCMKHMNPLIKNFKEELSLISQNFGLKNRFESTINVVAEEMQLVLPNQAPPSSLEQKVQLRSQNKLNIKF